MNKKITFPGGEPDIRFEDLLFTPNANREALIDIFTALGDNYIIQGCAGPGDPGYIMLAGEILQVDAHTATGTRFEKVVTYEAGGDKTFNNGTPRQTRQQNRATQSASSGGFPLAGADRLADRIVISVAASSTEQFAEANIPALTAAKIPNLDASKITTGILDVLRIPDLAATKITSGVLDAARIPDLAATKITSGVLDAARIPDLSATKITSGTLASARLDLATDSESRDVTETGKVITAPTLNYAVRTVGYTHIGPSTYNMSNDGVGSVEVDFLATGDIILPLEASNRGQRITFAIDSSDNNVTIKKHATDGGATIVATQRFDYIIIECLNSAGWTMVLELAMP